MVGALVLWIRSLLSDNDTLKRKVEKMEARTPPGETDE
jgi:hypothetical protein